MPRVGIVTCVELPEPDPDQELLLAALRNANIDAEMIAWDNPQADPSAFDLCVPRSCWNYHWHWQAFLDWISRADKVTHLVNSAAVIRENIHKGYLQKLEKAGVPIIPTAWDAQGASTDLLATMNEQGWEQVVIKPAISAASFRTERFAIDDVQSGQSFLEALVRDADAMVQRYMKSVEEPGERAIVWIDSQATHAVVKSPRFADGIEQVSEALEVTDAERALATQALAVIEDELLYARVDIVEDDDGSLLVSELELIEPALFFMQSPAALEAFVAAIGRLATQIN
jgi:glutathione synthase/RimK-type ligase-like ATP-grasp enzyme